MEIAKEHRRLWLKKGHGIFGVITKVLFLTCCIKVIEVSNQKEDANEEQKGSEGFSTKLNILC